MKVLAFAASSRKGSLNRKLIELAAGLARQQGAEVDLAELGEFGMPLFDPNLDLTQGLPKGAEDLKRRVVRADALMIAAPEYNYSIAAPLKNAIDWVSRARPMPWRGKSIYLLSASPSPMGGIRGLWQTRVPLEGCGALVFPDMFALPNASEAFEPGGELRSAELLKRLTTEVCGFLKLVGCLAPVVGHPRSPAGKARQEEIAQALEDETLLQPKR